MIAQTKYFTTQKKISRSIYQRPARASNLTMLFFHIACEERN